MITITIDITDEGKRYKMSPHNLKEVENQKKQAYPQPPF